MSWDCYIAAADQKWSTAGNTAPVPEPPRRETGPQKPTIESIGGIEGMYGPPVQQDGGRKRGIH